MEITIDGIVYSPKDQGRPNVGIAVTVRDRKDVTDRCLEAIRAHTDPSIPVVIVDDQSVPPYPDATYRFDTNVGIPAAKNKSLELLMDLGVDYLILLDNDCLPLVDNWVDEFVRVLDVHPHVSAQFKDLTVKVQLGDIDCTYDDGFIEAWTGQRGYCLAYTRNAIETVGGFDPIFGKGLYEHSDLANRIHSAGLTTFRYASPKSSHLLVESLDQSKSVQRTPIAERVELVQRNAGIHNDRRDSGYSGFVEFRQTRNVILTCLYTSQPDPQRGKRLEGGSDLLKPLLASRGSNQLVVLHDGAMGGDHPGVEFAAMPNVVNVYFQRWVNVLTWLRGHPEVDRVLACDGTDVEILKPDILFDSVTPGVLTVGSEHQIVGCDWMLQKHTNPILNEWMTGNRKQLLNAGVVMGDRKTVIEFIHAVVGMWELLAVEAFIKKQNVTQVGDMGVFNYVAYNKFGDRLNFGPHVTTLFKKDERNDYSLIKHK